MAGLYIKLDYDWLRDPKVRTFRKEMGKAALVDLVQLYIAMARNKGRVDMRDYGEKSDLLDIVGMPEKKAYRFLDMAAACGVINEDLWKSVNVVTSARAVNDANLKEARSGAGKAGGEASGKARQSRQGSTQK